MTNFNVDSLLAGRSVTAGAAIKVVQGDIDKTAAAPGRQPIGTPSGVTVTISPAATKISLLLKSESTGSTTAAINFDAFLDLNHQQIKEHSKNADFLQELPDDLNHERQTVAKQAANYLLEHHYGEEKLYGAQTAENPFASLDRVTLSKISFNDSGLFTPAERQVAFLEMTNRDMLYRNETYDLGESLRRADDLAGSYVINFLRDAKLEGTMSEGEKAWRKWPTATQLEAIAAAAVRNDPVKLPTLPEYQNLNSQGKPLLAFMVGGDGSGTWKNIAFEELASETMPVRLIHSLIEKTKATPTEHPWLSLYLSIDSLGR
nr:hypothetical protein [Pseudomonas sp.]